VATDFPIELRESQLQIFSRHGQSAQLPVAKVIHLADRAAGRSAGASKNAGGPRSFEQDQEIFGEGDPADFLFEVLSGAVRTFKVLSDGRRLIDAFHVPGDIFGIEAGCEYRFSAEAIKATTVRAIRRRNLDTLARSEPETSSRLVSAMAQSLERAQDHMLLLGRKTAREKIASFLLSFADRITGSKTLELPMSRTDIADHLGLTIETVSRTLTQFEREKLIELPSTRRVIALHNLTALRQLDAGDAEGPARLSPRECRPLRLAVH
jgi:CRP/FNR family transcriptional regulator, nitrogen fixation regulation protein